MKQRKTVLITFSFFQILLLTFNSTIMVSSNSLRAESPINTTNIRQLMQDQIDMGPRIPGTQASLDFQTWLFDTVDTTDWQVETQAFTHLDIGLRNFWMTSVDLAENTYPCYIIGAHYDSRAIADKESSGAPPVPGANDGASGVAGILELMNHIPAELRKYFGFVMFDGEDQGGLGSISDDWSNWNWIVGSEYFVDQLSENQISETRAFVLFDMIADVDFRLPYERGSDSNLISQIWGQADLLGYGDIFVDEPGPGLTDDHIPFKNAGIPSIDIIDFTYPEHHKTSDDMDHISETSVAIVVDVTLEWIKATLANEITISEVCGSNFTDSINQTICDSTSQTSTSSDNNYPSILLSIFSVTIFILIRLVQNRKN